VGDRVVVNEDNGILKVESAVALVKRLAGSVKKPKRFRGMSDDEIIELAIKEHYSAKYEK